MTGIWIDPGIGDVAFVWSTDLTFTVYQTTRTEAESLALYEQKAAEEPDIWAITAVRGHPALGANLAGVGPVEPTSSLAFAENGLLLSFVSPKHTLDELRQLAEQLSYE